MWAWNRGHLAALALTAALIACPRPFWDRARLGILALLEPRTVATRGWEAAFAPDGHRDGPCEGCARLQAERARIEAERADLARALAAATALRKAVPALAPSRIVPAIVLGAEASSAAAGARVLARAGRVRLEAGALDGLQVGLPVADGAALLGRIVAVAEGTSEVELALAPAFRARCRNVRTGEEGIVRGAGDGSLRFRQDGPAPDLEPGDEIVTSRYSGSFPEGLLAGTVERVERDPETGLAEARLRPAFDPRRLEWAFVLCRVSAPDSARANVAASRGATATGVGGGTP